MGYQLAEDDADLEMRSSKSGVRRVCFLRHLKEFNSRGVNFFADFRSGTVMCLILFIVIGFI